MNAQKLIPLLDKIDALLENNRKIREELIRLLVEEEAKPDRQPTVASLTDILGIKVYLGKDYIEPTQPEETKIKIGEDLGNIEDIVKEEIEEYNSSFEVQDCGGNFVSVKPIDIPKSLDIDINREIEILEDEYLERTLDLWR
jgi:hypothetical protein